MSYSSYEEARLGDARSWTTILDDLAARPDDERTEALERLCHAVFPQLRGLAYQVVTRYDGSLNRFRAEAESIVAQEFFCLVQECVRDGFRPRTFMALLFERTRKVFGAVYARETSPSGTTAMARKRVIINRVKDALWIELGREPTIEQIAERATREAQARRADAKRQGMVFTAEAVRQIIGMQSTMSVDAADDRDTAFGATDDDPAAIARFERFRLANRVMEEAAKLPEPFPQISKLLWAPQLEEEPPDFMPAAAIAVMVGITTEEAQRARYKLIHAVPQEILAAEFGITSTAG